MSQIEAHRREHLSALAEEAIDNQLQASRAWHKLAVAYEVANAPWSAVLHCIQSTGISDDEIRIAAGSSPSTLSRWKDGLASPSEKLRPTLFNSMIALVPQNRTEVERRYRKKLKI